MKSIKIFSLVLIAGIIANGLITDVLAKRVKAIPLSANFKNAKAISVYDGDTFKVNLPCSTDVLCKKMGIRVYGVDTPEKRGSLPKEHALALKAKEFTKEFVKDGVDLEHCIRGKYFRLVCKVKAHGIYLNQALVKEKLGVPYFGGTKLKDWNK